MTDVPMTQAAVKRFSFATSFEVICGVVSAICLLLTLHTFIIGQHFIIPTAILLLAVVFGNLCYYGFRQARVAKYLMFWIGVMTTCHVFFALFWAKKYRELLGTYFEPVFALLCVVLLVLTYFYRRDNRLFVD